MVARRNERRRKKLRKQKKIHRKCKKNSKSYEHGEREKRKSPKCVVFCGKPPQQILRQIECNTAYFALTLYATSSLSSSTFGINFDWGEHSFFSFEVWVLYHCVLVKAKRYGICLDCIWIKRFDVFCPLPHHFNRHRMRVRERGTQKFIDHPPKNLFPLDNQ